MSAKVDDIVSIGGMTAELSRSVRSPEVGEMSCVQECEADISREWDPEIFAQQQVRALVQRIFFPGWPKSARQVVISSADAQTDSAAICARIVKQMAAVLPGTVCATEADLITPGMAKLLNASFLSSCQCPEGRHGAVRLEHNLWLVQPENVVGKRTDGFDVVYLQTRLGELRRNFDYSLIHAPAAYLTQALLLGQWADGLILVVQARRTHRAVARKTLEQLRAAKIAVLGTILTERTFPVPEKLYKKL